MLIKKIINYISHKIGELRSILYGSNVIINTYYSKQYVFHVCYVATSFVGLHIIIHIYIVMLEYTLGLVSYFACNLNFVFKIHLNKNFSGERLCCLTKLINITNAFCFIYFSCSFLVVGYIYGFGITFEFISLHKYYKLNFLLLPKIIFAYLLIFYSKTFDIYCFYENSGRGETSLILCISIICITCNFIVDLSMLQIFLFI
ncbi:hypothetical protein AGLY_003212 [Aphis glycines]|uniref:Uncharacterized protein n=1 Tax=Aphis glycines TaxID=307491 RepID=A0A6G0U2F9_APHGL|nr:hypothetical protein AGLY_003212 [Aphis glycines]